MNRSALGLVQPVAWTKAPQATSIELERHEAEGRRAFGVELCRLGSRDVQRCRSLKFKGPSFTGPDPLVNTSLIVRG